MWRRASPAQIAELGPFELLTRGDELPVFAFKLKDEIDNYTVFDVSNALRERGWQVPAYTFPANRTDLAALRVVVRRGFTHDLADLLVNDIKRQLPRLAAAGRSRSTTTAESADSTTEPAAQARDGARRRRGARAVSTPTARGRSSPASATGWPTAGSSGVGVAARTASVSRPARPALAGARLVWIAVLFMVGSACFALGSLPGYVDARRRTRPTRVTYFVGSIFFTVGRRTSSTSSASAPRPIGRRASRERASRRSEPRRIDWWATSIQLVGTVFFNVTTFAALDAALTPQRADLVVWRRTHSARSASSSRASSPSPRRGTRWLSWRPDDHGLADRRPEPARLDLLRHLGDRRSGCSLRPATC